MKLQGVIAASSLLIVAGCAVNPSVRYQVARSSAEVIQVKRDYIDAFYQQRNKLRIEFKNTAADGKPPKFDLLVQNARVEDADKRWIVLRGDPFWSRTLINIAKVENTDLISNIGVEVADRRGELITTGASVVKTLGPALLGAGAAEKPCDGNDPAEKACEWQLPATTARSGGAQAIASMVSIQWGPVPSTATEASTLGLSPKERHNGLYYAACRQVTVTYIPQAERGSPSPRALEWTGKVADPNWLEYTAFPRKGKLQFHSQCGVSVTSEKDPTLSTDALVLTAVTQAVAVKEALDKANKDGGK